MLHKLQKATYNFGNINLYPESQSFLGTTLLLFNISSESVFMKKAPR